MPRTTAAAEPKAARDYLNDSGASRSNPRSSTSRIARVQASFAAATHDIW